MTKDGHSHEGRFDAERVAAALEVEGRLASGLAAEAIALCADRFADQGRTVERVVDLGSGPGIDTAQLAERFPSATVVAADGSTVTAPEDPATRKFLGAQLRATARNVADFADPADVEALVAIVDASRDARWDGVTVTSSRELLMAQAAVRQS